MADLTTIDLCSAPVIVLEVDVGNFLRDVEFCENNGTEPLSGCGGVGAPIGLSFTYNVNVWLSGLSPKSVLSRRETFDCTKFHVP